MTQTAQPDLQGQAPAAPPGPVHFLTDGQIDALADDLALHHRAEFLRLTAHMPVDALIRCMRFACTTGWGSWPPVTAPPNGHPGTHLHEPHLFGIHAMGATEHDAACNWRSLARTATPGWEGGE